jgi:hypothetical protein
VKHFKGKGSMDKNVKRAALSRPSGILQTSRFICEMTANCIGRSRRENTLQYVHYCH